MKFETVKGLKDEQFRRLTGVKRTTFNKMVEILKESIEGRKASSGRKKKL
ncbi:MAG: IS5/IS1182 family transposase, partial [Verrucomicrobia bacterium]|nr:IS5/IS1182 family transposase [Verrucomicrobiota bacterium]